MRSSFKARLARRPAHYTDFPEWTASTSSQIPPYIHVNVKAQAFYMSSARIKALFGGNKSGKTHTNVARQIAKTRQTPGGIFWACTETSELVGAVLWPKFQEMLAPGEIPEDNIAWANKKLNCPRLIIWPNGAKTYFKTYEQGRKAFQSADIDDALFDEEPEDKGIKEETLGRLIKKRGQLCLSMTPLLGKTWPYWEIDQNNHPGMIESWRISLFENPFIPQAYKDEIVALWGPDEIPRRVEGLFTILEGAIVKTYDEHRHIWQDFPKIPMHWRRAAGIDLGDTFCIVWGALDPETHVLYVYDEYYKEHDYIVNHAAEIRDHEAQRDFFEPGDQWYEQECRLADHDRQERTELEYHHIYTDLADKRVDLSIQMINRAFLHNKIVLAPWLYWLPLQLGTIRHKPQKETAQEKEKTEILGVKHAWDAFRYLFMYFFAGEDWLDLSEIQTSTPDDVMFSQ